jgi:thioredoxin-related protein
MKKLFILPILVLASAFTFQKIEIKPIEIGTSMPMADQKMTDVLSDKSVTLNESKGEKGLLVMFSCNTCPFVVSSESRIIKAQEEAKKLNIGMVVINSNEAKRDGDDSQKEMAAYGQKQKYTVPYLMDASSALADAFGATRTPECFLFDKSGKLVYHGAIDDNTKDETAVTKHYLTDAMTALSEGKAIATPNSVSVGCSIKRK